jgi:hypothetical protein
LLQEHSIRTINMLHYAVTNLVHENYISSVDSGLVTAALEVGSDNLELHRDLEQSLQFVWKELESFCVHQSTCLLVLERVCLTWVSSRFAQTLVKNSYTAVVVYVLALKRTRHTILEHLNDADHAVTGSTQIGEQLATALETAQALPLAYLADMDNKFPDVCTAVKTQIALGVILNERRHAIQHLYQHGTLDSAEQEKLISRCNKVQHLVKSHFKAKQVAGVARMAAEYDSVSKRLSQSSNARLTADRDLVT